MAKKSGNKFLVESVVKKNKGLSIGLWMLFFLMTVIVVTTFVLPDTVTVSVENFLKDYGMPKAWITTRPLPIGNYKTDGITSYEADFAADMFLFDESDTPLSFRVFSVSKNSHRIFHIVEKSENETDFPSIYVTAKFAESSGIHPGDILSVKAGTDTRVFVESIVSLPEALVCVRNDGSWQDANDFGYAYLSREDYDSIFDTSGLANQWFVCFEDGLTNNQKESALSVFASKIGGEQGSAVLFENSEIRKTIDVMVDALSTACRYFPMAIYIIGLFFGSLFVRQLVLGDRKKIGLLRALGYSVNQILNVFLRYILLLSVSAIVPGIATGAFAVRTISGAFREMYELPGIDYGFSLPAIIGLLLSVILVGIVSCLVSARNISKIDPSEAYCDIWHDTGEIPRFFKRIRLNPFVKTSIGSIIRGRSRFFRSVISICACMVLMISSLLYYATQNEVFPVTFGERFRYDFLVSVNSGGEIEKQLQNIVGVSETEPVNTFRDELSFGGETKSVLVCAICDDGKLIVPSDVSGKALHLQNGVILDEWTAKKIGACENDTVVLGNISLKVDGISRELVNSTQYISVGTAALLDKDDPEYIAIKLEEGADTAAVQKEIAGISGCVGITGLANQQKSYLEMIKLVNMVLIIIVGISLMLGIVILYNMTVLNISERKRTNATLSALGATGREFTVIAVCENALLYIFALIPACPIAYIIAKYFLETMSSDEGGQYLPIVHLWEILILSAVLSLIYLVVGILVTLIKIHKTDLALALNSRE